MVARGDEGLSLQEFMCLLELYLRRSAAVLKVARGVLPP